MSKIRFPDWFDARKVQRLQDLDDHHGGGWAELSRETLVKAIDQVYRAMPDWSAHPDHAPLAISALTVLRGIALDNGAKPLHDVAHAVRRNYADEKAGKPVAPRAPLVAELLRECERTRAALLACGAASAGTFGDEATPPLARSVTGIPR